MREISKLDLGMFKQKLTSILSTSSKTVGNYDTILTNLLNEFAPEKQIKINKNKSEWWNGNCNKARQDRRRAERHYKKHRNNLAYYQDYKEKQIDASIIINQQIDKYYSEKLSLAFKDPKKTYKIVNKLLDNESGNNVLPN